ncbi:MAG TPA: FAD-dependent oxidoreductase, partial [Novosphingobium capsulatum]|nr:FAD-dependent oxidoreductase [Novosphingobium capsulatum]
MIGGRPAIGPVPQGCLQGEEKIRQKIGLLCVPLHRGLPAPVRGRPGRARGPRRHACGWSGAGKGSTGKDRAGGGSSCASSLVEWVTMDIRYTIRSGICNGVFVGLIGIVGGGVVGLCAGLDLLEAGHGVVLVDDDPRAQAPSWGNAGHVATEQVEPLASLESLRSVPGRLFTRGGPLAFPPGAIARWMPFGMRLLAASAPARFRSGCAAMRPLKIG